MRRLSLLFLPLALSCRSHADEAKPAPDGGAARAKGLEWLAKNANADGSFGRTHSVAVTGLACLAWLVFLVPASWLYHFKFMFQNGGINFPQLVTGWKNVSIAGGLIALILLDASRPAWLFPG